MLYRNSAFDKKDIALFDMPLLNVHSPREETVPEAVSSESIEREAYNKAFEAGEKAGFDMGEQKAAILIERLEGILGELAELRKKIVAETEPQFVELAAEMARKIVLRELTTDPGVIVEMAKEALMRLERNGQIIIKINSTLHGLFMKHKETILNIHPDIVFDIDPSAPLHGSVVVSPSEDVITDLDEQLRNLIREMGERLHGD